MCNSGDLALYSFTTTQMSPHDLNDRQWMNMKLNAKADTAYNEIVLPELLNQRKMCSINKKAEVHYLLTVKL